MAVGEEEGPEMQREDKDVLFGARFMEAEKKRRTEDEDVLLGLSGGMPRVLERSEDVGLWRSRSAR